MDINPVKEEREERRGSFEKGKEREEVKEREKSARKSQRERINEDEGRQTTNLQLGDNLESSNLLSFNE